MVTRYKGCIVTDVTTRTEDGRYRARAAIVWLDAGRTRSQRFLDLETFRTRFEAHAQVLAAAIAWIDAAHDEIVPMPSPFQPTSGGGDEDRLDLV